MAAAVTNQTVTYTFIANYLIWAALFLVAWMSFVPILSVRRAPAIALSKLSRMVGLTRKFNLTTILMLIALVLVGVEFMSMQGRQKAFYSCKEVLVCPCVRTCMTSVCASCRPA